MKTKNIIIAASAIIIFSSLLTGCKLIEKSETQESAPAKKTDSNIQQMVQKAEAVKKEVRMVFESQKEGDQVKITIALENPDRKPITSVQSWLAFDTEKVKGKEINTSKSAFSLMAPYDNTFDNENGLVMLGRANPDPITNLSINVAEVVFDVAGEGTIMIDAHDYREDVTGHVSVNTVIDGKPYNILIKPESPALVIEN